MPAYVVSMMTLHDPDKTAVEAWFANSDYEQAMAFRHAASTMSDLLLQEGGPNTEDPDRKL
jgi:uncharacterized protein (DUF1330 family)